jgi:hypothetical protein
LTAETVITRLEDPEDYKAFERAVTADYDAQTAVERELVLRVASLLWRLRRATLIETALLQIEPECSPAPAQTGSAEDCGSRYHDGATKDCDDASVAFEPGIDLARRFLRLAELDHGVFDRLGR